MQAAGEVTTAHDVVREIISPLFDTAVVSTDDYLRRLKLIRPAVSIGGIEITICSPARTSHAKMSAEERKRIGVTDALLRLSVGIEHVDDLIEDLQQAMG